MTEAVLIRKMTRSDTERVTEIDEALFGSQRFPTWPFSFQVYWREYSPDIGLVAEVGENVVGFIVGCLVVEDHNRSVLSLRRSEQPRPAYQVGWIDMIGVQPGSQNAGVGSRLVQAFCSECKSANVSVRAVARENDARLRHFLEAAGFRTRDLLIYEKDT